MPLPSREEVLTLLQQESAGLDVDRIADALGLGAKARKGLLRMLDSWVFEGVLEGRSGDRFALPRAHNAPREAYTPKKAASKGGKASKSTPSRTQQVAAAARGREKTSTSSKSAREGREGSSRGEARASKSSSRSDSKSSRGGAELPRSGRSSDGRISWRQEPEAYVAPSRGKKRGTADERQGVLTVNSRGFGFVSCVDFPGQDVFVQEDALGGALHGDTVVVRITAHSSRGVEGTVVRVVVRGKTRVGGILHRKHRSAWVEADDTRFRRRIVLTQEMDLAASEGNNGEDGDSVVVEITRFPEMPDENPEGRLLAVLGRPGELGSEVRKVLLVSGIDEVHTASAIEEAEAFGAQVPKSMLAGRVDLTAVPLPTIDPEDARDHDDAVWVTRKGGGYEVHIAIADVSSYVTPGTALDDEAKERGCSVYLPERAIPMLPRALSSNLCSLLPDQIRLCLCVIAQLDAAGKVRDFKVVRGFMKSQAKLTYGGVARALGLSDSAPVDPKAEAMKEDLKVAFELSRLLRTRRLKRGALDFELPEPRVVFGDDRQPVDVQARGSDAGMKKAYQLIEELMLLGNELMAQFLVENDLPGIFRVHLPPDEAKLSRLVDMCELLGVEIDLEETKSPKSLGKLLARLAEHPHKHILHGLLLRSMKQAAYDVQNLGHFGLASDSYLHFTSPIRRYPDLVVHRVVHAAVQKQRIDRSDEGRSRMAEAAALASSRERRAMEVEREVLDLYKCTVMQQHIGETFEGTVTAIVGSGLFVNLTDPFVDVLVRFEDLGAEPFGTSEDGLRVYGKRSGYTITLGDRLAVTILESSMLRRTVYAKRVGTLTALSSEAMSDEELEGFGEKTPGRGKGRGGVPSRNKKASESRGARSGGKSAASSRAGKSSASSKGGKTSSAKGKSASSSKSSKAGKKSKKR